MEQRYQIGDLILHKENAGNITWCEILYEVQNTSYYCGVVLQPSSTWWAYIDAQDFIYIIRDGKVIKPYAKS